ncbi:uncharacterized protein LOC119742735 isoform X2 [Patiria miniata]|uniref:DUF7789 domain-containing protein n=1 Tax=Patiria miniata TaxID=46514 RepID=A0A914BFH2_PATMI|nr:uncharacterized protein LOC119742735 isoform X2 [Patiria miniata]
MADSAELGIFGSMASTDPTKSSKAWSSGSDTDPNLNDEPVTFADLGVRREAEIVETYFGKRRPLSSLTVKEWAFTALAVLSILGAAGLTVERIVDLKKDSPDVTFAIVLLLTLSFCLFYVLNGIFGERPYELIIFIVGTLIMMIYCIVNYAQTINPSPAEQPTEQPPLKQYEKDIKLARLIIVVAIGPVNIVLGSIIAREYYLSRNLIFRTVGANIELQDLCSRIFFTESLFKIDLQLELTLVILVLKTGLMDWTTLEVVVLVVGVVYSIFWCGLGFLSMYKENKIMVYVLLAFSWCEPAYIIYKLVDVGLDWDKFQNAKLIPAAIIIASVLGLLVRVAVCGFMVYVYKNFDRGMREKAYGKVPRKKLHETGDEVPS